MGLPAARAIYFETGSEPEVFITEIKLEDAGGNNIRVFAYHTRHGNERHLVFTVIVPIGNLATMGRQALRAAVDVFNGRMWATAIEDTEH